MKFARGKAGFELAGDFVQAGGGVAHDEPGLAGARVSCVHRAGLASIFCGFSDFHAGFRDDAGYGVFLLVERESLDGAGEVFYGIELIVARDNGDADGIYVWIQ